MQLYSLVQDAFMKLFSWHILLSGFSDFHIIFVGFFLDVQVTLCQIQSHYFIVRYPRLEHTRMSTVLAPPSR